ncbi:Envelope fusion protein [Frankliniella fusca]|uniref:Envelope fusion protein n=1 Tax=Frankliniella fusca TaxID=407009 RepID=A0AAE1LPW2_9NEOP|nr:Envelope fusion protein [Frankliniella fusca]
MTMRSLIRQEEAIRQLSNITYGALVGSVTEANEFSSAMRQAHLALQDARAEVRSFVAAWHLANSKQVLSPYFIDPHRLMKTLQNLTATLPPGLSLPVAPLSESVMHFYYAAIRTSIYARNNTAWLLMRLPLVMPERKITIYEAVSWPHPTPDANIQTYFLPETKYIATNEARSMHMLLTREDLESCDFTRELRVCTPKVALYKKRYTCAFALLMSDPDKVTDHCESYYVAHPSPRFLSYRGGQSWAYTLSRPANLYHTDNNGSVLPIATMPLPANGILHLPPNAVVKVDDVLLYAGSSHYYTVASSDNILLPWLPDLRPPNFTALAKSANDTWSRINALLGSGTNASANAELQGMSSSRIAALLHEAEPGQRYLYDMAAHLFIPASFKWYHYLLLASIIIAILVVCVCCRLYEVIPPLFRGFVFLGRHVASARPANRKHGSTGVGSKLVALGGAPPQITPSRRQAPQPPRLSYEPEF